MARAEPSSFPLSKLIASESLPTCDVTLKQYRKLLDEPRVAWSQFRQFVDYTRSYDRGLEIGLSLLSAHERLQESLTEEERESKLTAIYVFILCMLDKLDRWDEFVDAFDRIFKETRLTGAYYHLESSREFYESRGWAPYIIEEGRGRFRMHFLHILHKRRAVIQRKIERRNQGKKLGNVSHARQSDLTEDEVKARADWLLEFFRTGIYDFDPPASRPKEAKDI